MTILESGPLPEDLSRDEVLRLANYASRLTEHAAMAHAKHCIEMTSPSADRLFYLHGLDLCRHMSPEAVEVFGLTIAEDMTEAAGDDADTLIRTLHDYYWARTPLSSQFARDPFFAQSAAMWAAVSDVHSFNRCFIDHVVHANDSRDTVMCLQRSLGDNGLLSAFNRATIIHTPSDPSVMGSRPQIELSFESLPARLERQRLQRLTSLPPPGTV